MANEQTAVATREPQPIVTFRRELEDRAGEIKAALPQHISAEKFQRTVTTAAMQNPDLLKADRRSLILACIKAAQDGLLPDGREAALVTFKTSTKEGGQWVSKAVVQYMPMVYGLRKKVLQARNPADGKPLVVALETNVVYRVEAEKGYFRYEVGTEPPLQHRPMLDIAQDEAGDDQIVAAYSIATMADGTKSYELMRRFEIDKVRQVSQTGAIGRTIKFGADKGKALPPKGPWVDWFAEMAKKTVVRRHTKTLPMTGDVLLDIGTDESEFEAATGAASVLDSGMPDAAQLVDGRDGDEGLRVDPETGEIHDGGEPEQTTERKTRGRGKAKPDEAESVSPKPIVETTDNNRQPSAVGNGRASAATAQSSGAAESTESGATISNNGPTATTSASPSDEPRDEIGITQSPADTKADELLQSINRSETVIDLEKHMRELDRHRGALEPEHLTLLDQAYKQRSDKLYGVRESAQ